MSRSGKEHPFIILLKTRIFKYDLLLVKLHPLNFVMQHLSNTLSNTPDLYLDELRLELEAKHGVSSHPKKAVGFVKRFGQSLLEGYCCQ